jgi:hypothetical protein
MRTDAMIVGEALNILEKKFNPLELQRFIVAVNRTGCNYTEWRRRLQEQPETLESLSHKAQMYYENTVAKESLSADVAGVGCKK